MVDSAMNGDGPFTLRVVYSTQQLSSGVKVTATLQWLRGAYGYSANNGAAGYSLSIGGSAKTGTRSFSAPAGGAIGAQWIETHAVTFTSGTSTTITASFNTGTSSGGSGSISFSVPITTASVSTFSSGSSVELGQTVTVNTNRTSSSYTHTVWLAHNTLGDVIIGTGVGASASWTVPTNLLDVWPSHNQVLFNTWTRTFLNGNIVGSDQKTTLIVKVPAAAKPAVTGIVAEDMNADVAGIVGKFVQGLSRAKLTVNSAGIYGSVIESSTVTMQAITVASGGEIQVTQSGDLTVTGEARDSRGRVGTGSATLQALAYAQPVATSYQARRCTNVGTPVDDGAYLRVDLTAAVSSLINSTQRNEITIRAFTRPRGTVNWTPRNVIIPAGAIAYNTWFLMSGGDVFATTSSWDVRVRVEDKFGVYIADTTVATIGVTLDLGPNGIGVGKLHEQGALDVSGQIYQNNLPVIDTGDAASETSVGVAELATQAEVNAGDATRIVTASKIRNAAWGAYSEARGRVSCAATGVTTVTFPSGRFTVAPNLQATPVENTTVGHAHITDLTATSVGVRFFSYTGGQLAGTVDWFASQATATTAGG